MNKRPNILFITTDQQQKKTLGAYGNRQIETPHLDRLASSGITLDRAYCENPICIPSRNTMITGRKSMHHGSPQHNSSLRSSETCLGDVLSNNGYRTHFIGKPHFKSQQTRGTEESIEDWRDGCYDTWTGPYAGFETVETVLGHSNPLVGHYGKWMKEHYPESVNAFAEERLLPADVSCGHGVFRTDIPEAVHSSTYVGDRTVDFLKEVSEGDAPFYCFASFPDPHWPLMTPPEYFEMYNDIPIDTSYQTPADDPNLKNYPSAISDYLQKGEFSDYDGGGHRVTDDSDIEIITRAYWGSVSLIDRNIGRILSALEELNLREGTLVIFTTDHGEYMGAHGMMAKGGICWEEYINVPFIASWPGHIPEGSRTSSLFSFTDIVPTLLDAADLIGKEEIPLMPFDGISQKEMLCGRVGRLRDALTVHHARMNLKSSPADQHVLITDAGWKLVYFAGDNGGQLYNLNVDPGENRNLYNLPEHAEIQSKLVRELLDRLILESDREPVIQKITADPTYAAHVMKREIWGTELD